MEIHVPPGMMLSPRTGKVVPVGVLGNPLDGLPDERMIRGIMRKHFDNRRWWNRHVIDPAGVDRQNKVRKRRLR